MFGKNRDREPDEVQNLMILPVWGHGLDRAKTGRIVWTRRGYWRRRLWLGRLPESL